MRALYLGVSWAGLFTGPLAWALSTQANYAIVPWQCAYHIPVVPILALILALFAASGGAISWRTRNSGGAAFKPEREDATERFLAMLGVAASALFTLVIVMQGAASLILGSCVR